MGDSNCVVIVWLLYGYCVVQIANMGATYLLRLRFLRCNSRWRLLLIARITTATTTSTKTTTMKITSPLLKLSPLSRYHMANISSV